MEEDRRDVTVTVTNWNGRHYLEECLDAVFAQTHPVAEVIVVDNASEDGSADLVREKYPHVRLVELETNEGPCPARNAGLEASNTELVLSIDNDAMLAPDCLEKLMPHLADDVAVVHPRSLFHGERDRIHYDGAAMHYVGMMTLHHFYAPLDAATEAARDIDAAISVALLMRRTPVLEAGGYDSTHFILFEDHDLSYRLRSRGLRIVHEPAALVYHKEGTAGISFREKGSYAAQRVYLHSRNRWVVILKCHGLAAIILGLPGLVLYEAAYVFFAIKNRCFLAWLRGKWDLLKLVPHVFRERKRVQRSRQVRDRVLLGSAPLTVSPLISRGGLVRKIQGFVDVALRTWWKLVGPLT